MLDYGSQAACDLYATGFQGWIEAREREGNTSVVLGIHCAQLESADAAPEENKRDAGWVSGPARTVRPLLREDTPSAGIEARNMVNELQVRRAGDELAPPLQVEPGIFPALPPSRTKNTDEVLEVDSGGTGRPNVHVTSPECIGARRTRSSAAKLPSSQASSAATAC
jgi:hypothetical protein